MTRHLIHRSSLLLSLPPLLLAHCVGSPVYEAPDYTPIGSSFKFIGVCAVMIALVITFASLISDDSH